jgi:hypothetical protein
VGKLKHRKLQKQKNQKLIGIESKIIRNGSKSIDLPNPIPSDFGSNDKSKITRSLALLD